MTENINTVELGDEDEHKPLLPEYKKYHSMGPKDCRWGNKEDEAFVVQINRQTNSTGEQLAIQVPVYRDDTREQMLDKIYLAYAIVGERLEDENKVMMNLTAQARARSQKEIADRKAMEAKAQEDRRLAKLTKKGLISLPTSGGTQ